jgi:hypothetical protein
VKPGVSFRREEQQIRVSEDEVLRGMSRTLKERDRGNNRMEK